MSEVEAERFAAVVVEAVIAGEYEVAVMLLEGMIEAIRVEKGER